MMSITVGTVEYIIKFIIMSFKKMFIYGEILWIPLFAFVAYRSYLIEDWWWVAGAGAGILLSLLSIRKNVYNS